MKQAHPILPEERSEFASTVASVARSNIDRYVLPGSRLHDPINCSELWNRSLNHYAEGRGCAHLGKRDLGSKERQVFRAYVDRCFEWRYDLKTEDYAEALDVFHMDCGIEPGNRDSFQHMKQSKAEQIERASSTPAEIDR